MTKKPEKGKGKSKGKEGEDEDQDAPTFHPVSISDKIYVRDQESELNWKNYRLETTFADGTHQEFLFTAPDDASAKKQVDSRKNLYPSKEGTYKLLLIEAPKELDKGELGSTKTIETNEKGKKASKDAKEQADAKAKDVKPKADAAPAKND